MNADVLLEHFHRLGDAPDAVPRLRRFILDLAVRGKLVAPGKADEPSAELLKRIDKDLRSRIASGEFKEPKSFIDFPVDSLPFNVPKHWAWVRLITIAEVSYGYAFDSNRFNAQQKGMPLIRIRDISKTDAEAYTDEAYDPFYVVRRGDMLIGMDGDFNIRKWKGNDALLNQRVTRVREWRHGIVDDFMTIPLQMILLHLHGSTSQTTVKHLSAKQLNGVLLPLPPLAEQHRIVAKVDELMALCDRLEAAQQQREQERTRLTVASWQALVTEGKTPGQSPGIAARFALEQLPALTTRPAQVKALRQTILDLAVRGKLVEQDATDEPAEVLLKRIAKEKESEGTKSKRQKAKAQNRTDVEGPFELPKGWVWASFPELGKFGRGKSKHRPRNDSTLYVDGTYPLVQTGDVARSKGVVTTYTNLYNDVGLAQSAMWPKGTMCITVAANIADSGILSFDACFPDSVVGFVPATCFSNARYFEYFLRTAQADLLEFAPATAQKNINLEILEALRIPLPPLAEQGRIVAKVDALMGLCDRLEAALVEGEALGGRLLEAVLVSGSDDQTIRRSDNVPLAYPETDVELGLAAEP